MKILILIYLVFIFPFVYQSAKLDKGKYLKTKIFNTIFTFSLTIYLTNEVLNNIAYFIRNLNNLHEIFYPIGYIPGFIICLFFLLNIVMNIYYSVLCIGLGLRSKKMKDYFLKFLPSLIGLDLVRNIKIVFVNSCSIEWIIMLFITLILELVAFYLLKRIYNSKLLTKFLIRP